MKRHGVSLSNPTSRARGIFRARVLDETNKGSSRVGATPHIHLQDPFDITVDDHTTMLEEAAHAGDDNNNNDNSEDDKDDNDEDDYLVIWDVLYHSDSDSDDGDDGDSGDDSDDSDFDFGFD